MDLLVIDRYTSLTIQSDSMTDDLDSAIEAIELLETDGKPIQVKDHLALGRSVKL